MRLITLPLGSRGADTILRLDFAQACALKQAGIDFAIRYLVSLTSKEIQAILDAGLALSLVTYANSFDPSDEIAALRFLEISQGACVFLDVEGVNDDPVTLQQRINTWAHALKTAGYVPGMYVGAQSSLTSEELYKLAVVRYWASASRILDRNGHAAVPTCDWCMMQLRPVDTTVAGVEVDLDVLTEDNQGRSVVMLAGD